MATREVVSIDSVIKEASDCSLPWKEFAPQNIDEWLTIFALAKGTCKEFIIVSAFPAVSALMANSVVEIFDGFEERVNLYMLALGGPSTGKTQSNKVCVTQPILHYLETKTGAELLLEDATSKGLFTFYTRSNNLVALCAIDECQEWFKTVVGYKTGTTAPSMKRLLQCCDGSHWYENKGNTNKRMGVPSAALALSCFTQPTAFLESVMPKLVSNNNGLLDRFLVCLPSAKKAPVKDRIEASKKLKETSLTSLDKIYEKIYAKHNNSNNVIYTLDEEALDIYVRHSSQSDPEEQGNAKDDKNIIRLAAIMYVFYEFIAQALEQRVQDVPTNITAQTLTAAITLAGYFEKQRAILKQAVKLGEVEAKTDIGPEDIQEAIIRHPGTYVTVKLVYRKFSSRIRPDSEAVKQEMAFLDDIGLGNVVQVERSDFFFKALPTSVHDDDLSKYGLSAQEYKDIFNSVDNGLTNRQRLRADINHPNAEFAEYTASQEEQLPPSGLENETNPDYQG